MCWPICRPSDSENSDMTLNSLERAMRFELTTPTLAIGSFAYFGISFLFTAPS